MTIRLKSHRLADRSVPMGRQPGKPVWLATVVIVTGGTDSIAVFNLLEQTRLSSCDLSYDFYR